MQYIIEGIKSMNNPKGLKRINSIEVKKIPSGSLRNKVKIKYIKRENRNITNKKSALINHKRINIRKTKNKESIKSIDTQ